MLGALVKHWSERFLLPDRVLQRTYEAFKSLLVHDGASHNLMAEFEELYHDGRREDFSRTRRRYLRMAAAVEGMVSELERMNPGQAGGLRDYLKKYDFYARLLLEPPEQFLIPPFAVDHDEPVEAKLIGNKSHNLLRLQQAGAARVPAGFTITATTFSLLVEHNGLRPALDLLLASIVPEQPASLEEISQSLMTLVRRMEIPDAVQDEILDRFDHLGAEHTGPPLRVAVRSSALHEDSDHSFAGQYHSVLGVGRSGLLAAYLEVVASKYTPEALLYRISAGLSDEEAAMAVLVLTMVDAAASGVVYTRSPAPDGKGERLLVQSVSGLGLPLVGGEITPDMFLFAPGADRPDQALAGRQQQRLVLVDGTVRTEAMDDAADRPLSVTEDEAVRLAAAARQLEEFFGAPQDIEWAVDQERELYILQSRPLLSETEPDPQATVFQPTEPPLVTGGRRASGELCDGLVHHLDPAGGGDLPRGAVLVTRQIPPSLVRHIHRLAGVVCERGAVTGHFATVCREFGVVLLVEAADALELLPAGTQVVVDARAGAVYPGRLPEGVRPAARDASADPYLHKLRGLLDYITPLHLVDPADSSFRPQSCRSLHDIIRYAHEKAMQTMFGLSDLASGKSSRCRLLDTDLAIDLYLLDVGNGFREPGDGETVAVDRVASRPFLALWQGLSHPDVDWDSHLHFDWKGFSDAALSGGVVSGGSREFASYAIVSGDYCNLNMRFGYHFTLVDCLCGDEARGNYCQLRFAGGGGDYQGRSLRIRLLTLILGRLGFEVSVKADLLDARIGELDRDSLVELLATVGRLLGATKLLDMVLKDEHQLEPFAAQFFAGAGRFTDRPADHGDPSSDTPAHG